MSLSPKQKQFCKEYLIDLNATQAAIRAGYSKKAAEVQGFHNLRNHKIAAEIERLQGLRAERTEISADYALKRTFHLADSNVFPILEKLKAQKSNEIPVELQKTVKSVRLKVNRRETQNGVDVTEEYSVTMHDVVEPLKLLWKHLGLCKDDAEAISTLIGYGKVVRTEKGFMFEYADQGEG